jgi:hypothetical protein
MRRLAIRGCISGDAVKHDLDNSGRVLLYDMLHCAYWDSWIGECIIQVYEY